MGITNGPERRQLFSEAFKVSPKSYDLPTVLQHIVDVQNANAASQQDLGQFVHYLTHRVEALEEANSDLITRLEVTQSYVKELRGA